MMILIICITLVLLTVSNLVEIKFLRRSRWHDLLEKIVTIIGGIAASWYWKSHEHAVSLNEEYILMGVILYFIVLNRLAVYFICNRLTKHLHNKNT